MDKIDAVAAPRPWDARLARRLVTPLKDTRITPNHLTTLRLLLGLAGAACLAQGGFWLANAGALLIVLSNFVDHTDGELARISGKSSQIGHFYDLTSDALVTILLFACMGKGIAAQGGQMAVSPTLLGVIAGVAVALTFFLRMRIESLAGKAGTRQSSVAGFETEDVLYLLPLVTLSSGVVPFLIAASVGAPLFALWVVVDYWRVVQLAQPTSDTTEPIPMIACAHEDLARDAVSASSHQRPSAAGAVPPDPDLAVAARTCQLDHARLRTDFTRQGAFLYLDEFLPAEVISPLAASARALLSEVNRNYLPGHKQGGSVSRHTIDRLAPFVTQLYRSKALIDLLKQTCGDTLLPCPDDDPHAYALYYYTRAGDHIGWHYDTSYYAGRRYTLLLGVIDDSSCRLDYELHTREPDVSDEPGSVRIPPGGLVFFDGDKLRHRITPLGANEMRVSLTFEYVTDPAMRPWRRFISNMKDAVAYFGFRQVFRQTMRGRGGNA
jgi:phosphatidylglycerophosphate synthase